MLLNILFMYQIKFLADLKCIFHTENSLIFPGKSNLFCKFLHSALAPPVWQVENVWNSPPTDSFELRYSFWIRIIWHENTIINTHVFRSPLLFEQSAQHFFIYPKSGSKTRMKNRFNSYDVVCMTAELQK